MPDGKKVGETSGTWKTENDRLYVDYIYGEQHVQAWYTIEQTSTESFTGVVIYDWDNDKEFDDTLTMKSKRIK